MLYFLNSCRVRKVCVFLFLWFCALFLFSPLKFPHESFLSSAFFGIKVFPAAVNWSISSHDHYPQGVVFSIHKFIDTAGNLWFCAGCPDDTYFLRSFTCIVIPSFSHGFCWLSYLQTLATTIISCVLLLKSPSSLALHKSDLLQGFFLFLFFLFTSVL